MEWMTDPQAWVGFLTLAALEIVLGIDNIIFISILVGKLPKEQQDSARKIGLLLAMGTRILLLFSLSWVMSLTRPLFTLFNHEVTGRDLVLIIGGLFLVWKSTKEIHERLEGGEGAASARVVASYASVLAQIAILDIVFSLDSVITAVGMVKELGIMVGAVMVAVGVMMVFAKTISDFVHRHPSLKVLALSFLLMIGVMLIGEGFGHHIPKGYVYFAMAFSVFVEMINIRATRNVRPVDLHDPYVADGKSK
jgi:predicted tellurium resistance membrane protein TerC